MIVVLGLGNPGRSFSKSRHNAGLWCVDALADKHRIRLRERRRHVVLAEGEIAGSPVVLAKSRTYMNHSAAAARYVVDRFRIPPEELLVVHDEMDLPVGTLRLRSSGGAAGHHGIESIIAELRTQGFPRLRIGVGHPVDQGDAIGHVLGRFTAQEAPMIGDALERAVEAIDCIVQLGLETAMNRFN